MKRVVVCLCWSLWFAAGAQAADALPALTRAASFDPLSGKWLVGSGPSWIFASTTGEQATNRALSPSGFGEGARFFPTTVRNGFVLGVVSFGEDYGFTVLMDGLGTVLFKGPLSPAFDLAEDGSAVLWVLDQGAVAAVEEYCHEKLPHGFAGTMVRSCPLPSGRCELDLYPDIEAGNDFRALSHRDVLVSLRDGGWSRLQRGQRQWTSTGQSWPRLWHFSPQRGEFLLADPTLGTVSVHSVEDGSRLFAWEVARDPRFLQAFLGEDDASRLAGRCRQREDVPVQRQLASQYVAAEYPADWKWRVAAAGLDGGRNGLILANGDLLVAAGNAHGSSALDCPHRGWVWVVSRATGSVARTTTITSLHPEAAKASGRPTIAVEGDGHTNAFVCVDLPGPDTMCYQLPASFLESDEGLPARESSR